MTALSTQTDN